jgi:hypothetical protein
MFIIFVFVLSLLKYRILAAAARAAQVTKKRSGQSHDWLLPIFVVNLASAIIQRSEALQEIQRQIPMNK